MVRRRVAGLAQLRLGRRQAQRRRTSGVSQGTNNINTFPFAGEILASGEQGGPPVALDPITLETKGVVRWSGQLSHGIHAPAGHVNGNGDGIVAPDADPDAVFAAHPKWDHETGELFGFAFSDDEPYVTIHVVSPDGRGHLEAALRRALSLQRTRHLGDARPHRRARSSRSPPRRGGSSAASAIFGWETELPITLALVPRGGFPDAPRCAGSSATSSRST